MENSTRLGLSTVQALCYSHYSLIFTLQFHLNFLAFALIAHAIEGSDYINISLILHEWNLVAIAISDALQGGDIREIDLRPLLETIDGKAVHCITPFFLASLRSLPVEHRTVSSPFKLETLHPLGCLVVEEWH